MRLGTWDETFDAELGSLDGYILRTTEGASDTLQLEGILSDTELCVLGPEFDPTLGSKISSVLGSVIGYILGSTLGFSLGTFDIWTLGI